MVTRNYFVFVLSIALLASCAETPKRPDRVKEVKRLEGTISAKGASLEARSVRAWVEDIERDVAAATQVHRLSENQSIIGMSISADGEQLVFSVGEEIAPNGQRSPGSGENAAKRDENGKEQESGNPSKTTKIVANLRGLRTKGGGITQITTGQWLDLTPAFGPGANITFASNRVRRSGMDIFRISAERVGGVSVIRQSTEAMSYGPSVAKDGTMVFDYFPTYEGAETGQIWALGGKLIYPVQLREGSQPAISPDGTEIAFIGPEGQLWVMPVTGQNPVQLTSSEIPKDANGSLMPKRNPQWSPDGQYIVYAAADGKDSDNRSNYDIWIISKNGEGSQQLTTNGSLDILPVVSPDAQFIYFDSNRGFREGIWRIPYPFRPLIITTEPVPVPPARPAPATPAVAPVSVTPPAAVEPASTPATMNTEAPPPAPPPPPNNN